jgi:hypothetical protein
MKIFSILKVDDDYSLKERPSGEYRLDPLAVPLKKSGTPTCPLDKVTLILIQYVIF